jgi:hypothetical protein
MVRRAATCVFVLCLTVWTILLLDLIIAIGHGGLSAIGSKLAYLFGETNDPFIRTGKMAFVRLSIIAIVTVIAGIVRVKTSSNRRESHLPN